MSKHLALACIYVGKGYGIGTYQHDLEVDTSYAADFGTANKLFSYAQIGVSMVEMAHNMAMEYPEGLYHDVYCCFGEWFADEMESNEDYKPPSIEECKNELAESVITAFSDFITPAQAENLRKQFNNM